MSLYLETMRGGIQSLHLALGGDTPETIAAFNSAYQKAAQRSNVLRARQQAQSNIASIEQDKVLSNAQIRINQSQAEANALVSAAAAGVEGQSVDDVIYDTERNEAFAINRNNAKAEQDKAYQVAEVGSQTSMLSSLEEEDSGNDYLAAVLNAASAFGESDLETMEAGLEAGFGQLWSK